MYGIGFPLRIARNPKSGNPVNLPAKIAIYFKPGKETRSLCSITDLGLTNLALRYDDCRHVEQIMYLLVKQKAGKEQC